LTLRDLIAFVNEGTDVCVRLIDLRNDDDDDDGDDDDGDLFV